MTEQSPLQASQSFTAVWNDGERHVPAHDPETTYHYRHMTAYHYAVTRFARGADLLDYGCGSGYGSNLLWRWTDPRSLVALDASPDAVAYCRAAYPDISDRFRVVAAGTVPLPASSIDAAVLFQTIEHVQDDRSLLQRIADALRPGGVLLVTTPNATQQPAALRESPRNPHHVREYTRSELGTLCRSVFAEVEELGVHGSFRAMGAGLGLERSLAFRVVRRMARPFMARPRYVAPVSLADFDVSHRRIEEALDLLCVCTKKT